jgi:hypothetical protein
MGVWGNEGVADNAIDGAVQRLILEADEGTGRTSELVSACEAEAATETVPTIPEG